MIFESTPLPGGFVVRYEPLVDERGFFARVFDANAFLRAGLEGSFPEHSIAVNRRANLIRGMHFAVEPHAEAKLVRCSSGAIFDVMVDVRPKSPTFGKWYGHRLGEPDTAMLYVPAGFAHGYQTLSETSEVHYLISTRYEPSAARGFRWDDPRVGIVWPLANPFCSERDDSLPELADVAFS
jgi:dTDP-4-dehydrorhamnose 3,5-epimerase